MNRVKKILKKIPVVSSLVVSVCIGIFFASFTVFEFRDIHYFLEEVIEAVFSGCIVGIFLIYPFLLTLINLVALCRIPKDTTWIKSLKRFEYITLVLGFLYSYITIKEVQVWEIVMDAEWWEVLYNSQKHQPIWSKALPTVIVLCVVGLIGYLVLSLVKLKKMPPLVIVFSMSAMYLGVSQCIIWCVQIFGFRHWLLCLFPFNCVIIALKTIRYKIAEWNALRAETGVDYEGGTVLHVLNRKLQNAAFWPVLALLMMLPLLGVILCVLVLFGQKPDALIKAWTETADWRLSEQIAPPNVQYDEHYLCTVAAGGHAGIVKPIRMGERHGHRVVVNRQLCIANAFEQILEEKTPKFHRFVRHIYDTYGFPVARLIRTKLAADIVYLCMKPLEWIFLMVIYLCDVKPENRIAVQYLPRMNNSVSGKTQSEAKIKRI